MPVICGGGGPVFWWSDSDRLCLCSGSGSVDWGKGHVVALVL